MIKLLPNLRLFRPASMEFMPSLTMDVTQSVFTQQEQRAETPSDLWRLRLVYPLLSNEDWRKVRAWWNFLRGGAHLVRLWDLGHPEPAGTMRGTPTLMEAAAFGSSTIRIAGSGTLLPGDMINVTATDSSRQLLEIHEDTGGGWYTVTPPLRLGCASGSPVHWERPYADFAPTSGVWFTNQPMISPGPTIELLESPS